MPKINNIRIYKFTITTINNYLTLYMKLNLSTYGFTRSLCNNTVDTPTI